MRPVDFLPFLAGAPLVAARAAWAPPQYGGYTLRWRDEFQGAAGSLPDENNWNIIQGNPNKNGELEVYTRSNQNLQISGGQTVQLVPKRNGDGWTSASIESKYVFAPDAGRVTIAEALIRFGAGDPGRKKGIWPAFWLLGDSLRHGGSWPACGEVDILEMINGDPQGYGTVHCDVAPGGICNEFQGIGNHIGMGDQHAWRTWRVMWDRRPGDWTQETITWFMDGQQYHQVSGARIGNANVWASLAHNPMYFILNVAVGGSWPGFPDGNTLDGFDSMMEVAYVAHYTSN